VLAAELAEHYPGDHVLTVYRAATVPVARAVAREVTLDRLPDATVDDISTLVVPPRARRAADPRMLARLGMLAPRPDGGADSDGPEATDSRRASSRDPDPEHPGEYDPS
jgi:hypothetical protein